MKLKKLAKSLITVLMTSAILFAVGSFVSADEAKSGWQYEKDYSWEDETGNMPSHWFYYENDQRVTGWKQLGGKWYYFDENVLVGANGAMASDCWLYLEGTIYHFNGSGVYDKKVNSSTNGWIYVNGLYPFDDDGMIYSSGWYYYVNGNKTTGWKQINNSWYYFSTEAVAYENGRMYSSVWAKIDNVWYHFNSSGVYDQKGDNLTGWVHPFDGYSDEMWNWVYFDRPGHAVSGWKQIDNKWYYFDAYNRMSYNTVIDGCYLGENGAWVTKAGWNNVGNSEYPVWVYIDSSSHPTVGWKKINNEWYYFNSNGHMAADEIVDGYSFDKDGHWINTPGWHDASDSEYYHNWYYVNAEGKVPTGWFKVDGKWYYADKETGYIVTNTLRTIDGKRYYFDEDGVWHSGWYEGYVFNYFYELDERINAFGYMYLDPDSKFGVATGWQKIDGNWYYFRDDVTTEYGTNHNIGMAQSGTSLINGKLYLFDTNGKWISAPGWYNLNSGNWYYMDNSGTPVTGWQQIDGVWYYFFSDGRMNTNNSLYIDEQLYFFSNSGKMLVNTWKQDYYGNWFYLNSNGRKVTDWYKIDNEWYYFYAGGDMAHDTIIDGYNLDSNGRIVS